MGKGERGRREFVHTELQHRGLARSCDEVECCIIPTNELKMAWGGGGGQWSISFTEETARGQTDAGVESKRDGRGGGRYCIFSAAAVENSHIVDQRGKHLVSINLTPRGRCVADISPSPVCVEDQTGARRKDCCKSSPQGRGKGGHPFCAGGAKEKTAAAKSHTLVNHDKAANSKRALRAKTRVCTRVRLPCREPPTQTSGLIRDT